MRRLLMMFALLLVPAKAQEQATGGWHALLVGCTEYGPLKERLGPEKYAAARVELRGPANDVAAMRQTLMDLFQVPDNRITVLVGWTGTPAEKRPTYANIVAALDRLAKTVGKGDRVVIHMAGHGSQVPDTDGDELDGLDEVFLPADVTGFDPKTGTVPNVLTDDELGAKVRAIRDAGAMVWLIMDCCHSGTMVRGAEEAAIRMRQLDPDVLGVPVGVMRGGGGDGDEALGAEEIDRTKGLDSIVAMYAAQSYRPAPEMPLPRSGPRELAKPHGLLTYMIVSQLHRAGGNVTFAQLQEQVLAAYDALPFTGTVPLAEGDLRLHVFGDGRDSGPALLVRAEGDKIVLNAGRFAGIVAGTVLAVYAPLKPGDPASLLGGVEVVSADPVLSYCRAIEMDGRNLPKLDPAGRYPAELRRCPMGDLRLKIAVVDTQGHALAPDSVPKAVLDVFAADDAPFALVSPVEARWSLVIDGDAMWLEPLQGTEGLRFEVKPETLLENLHHILRAENLMLLAGSPVARGSLPEGLDVRVVRVEGEHETQLQPGAVLHPGDQVMLAFKNGSGRIVDLALVHVDAHYGVNVVWPDGGTSPRLTGADRAETRLGPFTVNDRPLGTERLLILAAPRQEDDPVVDLTFLKQEPLRVTTRGPERTEIATEIRKLAFGDGDLSRGLDAEPDALGLATIVWRTEWGNMRGPRAAPSGVALRDGYVTGLMTGVARDAWQPAADPTNWRGDLSALYAKAAPAVVVVRTRICHGTGFLIDGEGLLLTNHHVAATGFEYDRRGRPWVKVHRGLPGPDGVMQVRGDPLPAEVLCWDPDRDLALLRVADPGAFKDVQPIPLSDTPPRPGQTCIMIGHPASGLLWSLRDGHVSGVGSWPKDCVDLMVARLAAGGDTRATVERQLGQMRQMKITLSSCQGNNGDSGGPLLDDKGSLLAVTHAIPSSTRGDKFVYHIHLDEVRAFLASRPKPDAPVVPEVPDPWRTGPRVGLAATGVGMAPDLLFAQSAETDEEGRPYERQFFLDVDDDAGPKSGAPEEAVRLLSNRVFDAEIAIHLLLDRHIAFYDTDNDGSFDLVLIDLDGNQIADVRIALRAGNWAFDLGAGVPWLSTDYLKFLGKDGKRKAMVKLKALMQ